MPFSHYVCSGVTKQGIKLRRLERNCFFIKPANFDGTLGAVAERLTTALRVAGSIPHGTFEKFEGLQVIFPSLAVCSLFCFYNHTRSRNHSKSGPTFFFYKERKIISIVIIIVNIGSLVHTWYPHVHG